MINREKIFSCSISGLDCDLIEVQADIANGLPNFAIVGMGDTSIKESKERIRAAIKNSGANFPQTRKTINLAPARLRKQGSLFDLPIAVALLHASGQVRGGRLSSSLLVGELTLDGRVKGVPGIIAITQFAKSQGFQKMFIPQDNASEASFIKDIEIYPIKTLSALISHLNHHVNILPAPHQPALPQKSGTSDIPEIVGLEKAKRALQIAAAGHHNILLSGSPGCGKTVLGRHLRYLLTPMTESEIMEVTKIHSVAGLTNSQNPLITTRPFREVHHTASTTSIIGGGHQHAQPGEISLAHQGVLFLDEIAEFRPQTIEALRQPLEDHYIRLTRANFSTQFPCNFLLVATMNPCPCGYHGDKSQPYDTSHKCRCSDSQIRNYQKKLSGPILDRFDLFVTVERTSSHRLLQSQKSPKDLLISIKNANTAQSIRFAHTQIHKNSDMSLTQLKSLTKISPQAHDLLKTASQSLNLSTRATLRTLKVAQTIADLSLSPQVTNSHLAEALQYRNQTA